jgi:hypothetical protein|tara:strand:+ start:1583 stop:1783 length:201 start_codon:yes stop_codon:yes gene_type:complete
VSHKVIIELEFVSQDGDSDEEQTVLDCDVYDYLQELIDDDSLDYTVTSASGHQYGVIKYKDYVRES